MQGTLAERAIVALGDYAFELETSGRRDGTSYGLDRTLSSRPEVEPPPDLSKASIVAKSEARRWETERVREWRSAGRLTPDGHLRVPTVRLQPYTLAAVMATWPHLNAWDRLAALVDLDGVVPEGFLESKEHENIKAVVERIADDRLDRKLQDDTTTLRIREIIREEVSAIFGELMLRVKAPPPSTLSGHRGTRGQNKCSKCHQPGHRATTCGRDAAPVDSPESSAATKPPADESRSHA